MAMLLTSGNTAFCCLGAISECYRAIEIPFVIDKLRAFLMTTGDGLSIIQWNDAPDRTYEQVIAALREADV